MAGFIVRVAIEDMAGWQDELVERKERAVDAALVYWKDRPCFSRESGTVRAILDTGRNCVRSLVRPPGETNREVDGRSVPCLGGRHVEKGPSERKSGILVQGAGQPSFCLPPVPTDGTRRQIHEVGDFFFLHAAEEPAFDHSNEPFVQLLELV